MEQAEKPCLDTFANLFINRIDMRHNRVASNPAVDRRITDSKKDERKTAQCAIARLPISIVNKSRGSSIKLVDRSFYASDGDSRNLLDGFPRARPSTC
jgi:hypothetical protein